MNWSQLNDPVSHKSLVGAMIASWSQTQEVASTSPFTAMTNSFVPEFAELSENI